jgi:hypothetical protein
MFLILIQRYVSQFTMDYYHLLERGEKKYTNGFMEGRINSNLA